MKAVIGVMCGRRVVLAACMVACLVTPAAAQAPAPLMTAVIRPGAMNESAGSGDVLVTLSIPAMNIAAGSPIASLPVMLPGASRPQAVADVTLLDAAGPAPVASRMEGGMLRWRSTRDVKGDVTIRYRLPVVNSVPLSGGPPLDLRVDGSGFSGVGDRLVMAPAGTTAYRITLEWDLSAMNAGAAAVTSHGDGDADLPVGPAPSRLGQTLVMAGPLKRVDIGAFSAVWTAEPAFDPRPAMQWTARMHQAMSTFFRDKVEPPYRVFLRFNPMNAGGGAAMPHSFIVTHGTGVTGENLKSILGHEMTHTWTANGLDKWYAEGNAVFYQALLPWRAGLITADQFLEDLNKTASRYYTNAMKSTPEAEVNPRFWEDTRIRVLPYDRGAMYFAVLNGKIRQASRGRRSIDDLILAMVERARAGQPISDAVWLDMLRQELGDAGPAVHTSMLAGGLMLPESDGFGPCFRRTVKQIRQFDVGFDMTSLVGAEKRISGLKPNSEAAKAGLRDGDIISYATGLDALQRDVRLTFTVQVTRDGRMFPVTYLPRGDAVDAYQWERVPGASEAACTPAPLSAPESTAVASPTSSRANATLSAPAAAPAQPQGGPPRPSNEPDDFLRTPAKPSSLKGPFTLTAVGELLYSFPLAETTDAEMQKVFSIVRQGDVTFGHGEVPFFDLKTFKGQGYGNGLLWGEAALAKDIKALGIDMVSLSSNHGTDWGVEGIVESGRLLEEQGVAHAGAGRNLREARRAGVFTTPKGRVALVSTASTFKPNANANDAMGDVPARGGISALRTRKINLVTPDQMAKVRELATQLASPLAPAPAAGARQVTLGDQVYRLSDRKGLTYEMDLYDHAALLKAVRDAKEASDLAVFTIHAHESPTGMDDDTPAPPDFLVKLFHNAVDAGADVILGTGQHSMRGIEIYKGRPVFYGMGAFFIRGTIKALQETVFRVFPDSTGHAPPPAPAQRSVRTGGNPASWYDGVVAQIDFEDGKARTVRLYPLDTGNTYEEARRGVPHFADPVNAKRILTNLQAWSAPFGTTIAIEGSVGVIRIP